MLDFGLARSVDDPSITQSGAVMGSPLYMSPEQLGGESLDARSDVFSLGLILYYCLTGEELFRADSISGIIAKQLSVRVPDVVGDDARVPASLKTLLLAMLEKKREDRPSDLGALIAEARRIVHGGDDETDESGRATLKLETGPAMKEVPTGDREDDGAARRRKRLKSLLDDL